MGEEMAGALMQRKARTFYLSSLFLPPGVRRDVRVLYSYFRTVDDLVDESGPDDARRRLDDIRGQLNANAVATDPIVRPLGPIVERYGVPWHYLHEVVDGALCDLAGPHFTTFQELLDYADQMAGSVGAVLCYILGDVHEQSLRAARELGIAMQLTNILRDIGEDLVLGRVYLPRNDMERFGYSCEALAAGIVDRGFRALMRFQIERARGYYACGLRGAHYLRPSCRFAVVLAAQLYANILEKIEQADFDVFRTRAHLSASEKLSLIPAAARATLALDPHPWPIRHGETGRSESTHL